MKRFKKSILHLPRNVGGHPAGLAEAETALGFDSHVLVYGDSVFRYPHDQIVALDENRPLQAEVLRWLTFWRSVFCYDVFHFNFGQKFLNFPVLWKKPGESIPRTWMRKVFAGYTSIFGIFDLWLIKQLGKRIVVTFQGDDVRQGDRARALFPTHFAHEVRTGYYDAASDLRKRNIIEIWDRYADVIFALNPDLLHVLPARAIFLPYAHVSFRDANWTPVFPEPLGGGPIRILHAPSDREVKGTKYVLAAVDRLKNEGHSVELKLVEGLSFEEARRLYESSDIVVDQLLAGWYGGFAVEAMALGKPVVAYIRESDLQFVPEGMRQQIPIVSASPDSVYEVLKDLVTHPEGLNARGRQSRAFVELWHDSTHVARRVAAYEGEAK